MTESETSTIRYKNRWFSYFDLLGFSKLVREHQIEYVLPIYEDVLETITEKAGPKEKDGIAYTWFSDTFVIHSKSDSEMIISGDIIPISPAKNISEEKKNGVERRF